MNCDYFGEVPNYAKGMIAETHVTLRLQCAVNLGRKGATVCPKGGGAVRARNADIRLAEENAALYLVTANGAAMSDLYASTADCSGVTYRNARIAVAGLGPGVDFCVRTKRGSVSHVFFTEDVESESTAVSLWYVTRTRR